MGLPHLCCRMLCHRHSTSSSLTSVRSLASGNSYYDPLFRPGPFGDPEFLCCSVPLGGLGPQFPCMIIHPISVGVDFFRHFRYSGCLVANPGVSRLAPGRSVRQLWVSVLAGSHVSAAGAGIAAGAGRYLAEAMWPTRRWPWSHLWGAKCPVLWPVSLTSGSGWMWSVFL